MKYLVLLCDGVADRPIATLAGKTIIEAANIPNINNLALNGMCGLIHTVPKGMHPGSDVCNLSIFGYNPVECYTGRSPLEAINMGINLKDSDVAIRCNIVKLSSDKSVMEDFTAGHINGIYSENVINRLKEIFKDEKYIEFYKGVGYRHIVILRDIDINPETTPPHDITGKKIKTYLPSGRGSTILLDIMAKASQAFDGNIQCGEANAIWLWGHGKKPHMQPFKEKTGLKGAVISAVDLVNGIGRCAGLDVINVPNATGFLDTNFEGKAEYAIKALENHDYVFVHVEATDECGHMGSIEKKIEAIEAIDHRMMPIIMKGMKKFNDFRILITPDHPTPIELKTHSNDPVPAIIYGSGIEADNNTCYSEHLNPSFNIEDGYKITDIFLKK